jgi:hypothetical protein
MMECLVATIEEMDANQAEMKANQAKADNNLREMREEMMARLEA